MRHRKCIFIQLPHTKTRLLQTLHRWLCQRYFIQQRGTRPIYYLSQLFSPGFKLHRGNFRKLISSSSMLNFQSVSTVHLLVYVTNQQILITICYTRSLIHTALKIGIPFSQFLRLRCVFSDDAELVRIIGFLFTNTFKTALKISIIFKGSDFSAIKNCQKISF